MMRKGRAYRFVTSWLTSGSGILTSIGSKWKSRRRLLQPAFHHEVLKDFIPLVNEQSRTFIKQLRNDINKDCTDVIDPISICCSRIVFEIVLGVKTGEQEKNKYEYLKSFQRVTDIMMERYFNFRHWFDFIFQYTETGKEFSHHVKILRGFTQKVIAERKAKLLRGAQGSFKKKRKALMDILMGHQLENAEFTDEDIQQELETFMFAGLHTISLAAAWCLYLIGLHKEVQDKIHEELDRIFGNDKGRPADASDLNEMTYMDCVLKECLRLYSPVPLIARDVDEDTEICGYNMPSGTTVVIAPHVLHRDENEFPNPEKFDPDRFLLENSSGRHRFAYIPFSAGPRDCFGQRLGLMAPKIILSTVLRHFTLKSLDPRDKILLSMEIALTISGPMRIKIIPRQ